MIGRVRLGLALTVVLFHSGFAPFGLQIGVSAVVAFFAISGYAMSAMWRRRFEGRAAAFYVDRVLRLYPQYVLFCACAAVLVSLGIRLTPFQNGSAGWVSALAHATVLPLSFVTIVPAIHNFILLPQSWSLGSELAFYMIFPLFRSRHVLGWTTAASLVVFALAAIGALDADTFTYRLLPGALFMFTLGTMIERREAQLLNRAIFALCAIALIITLAGKTQRGYNQELFIGIVAALVFLDRASAIKSGSLDKLAGDLSYGVYLSHFIAIAILDHVQSPQSPMLRGAIVVLFSLIAGALGYYALDRPVSALRKRLQIGRSIALQPQQEFTALAPPAP